MTIIKQKQSTKTCALCGNEFSRRETESWKNFNDRKSCSIECAARLRCGHSGARANKMEEAAKRLSSVMGYTQITPPKGRHHAETHSYGSSKETVFIQSGMNLFQWADNG